MSKFESSSITNEFQKQCAHWLNENVHVIAGISGGPDSMAMLYLLHRSGIKTTAVHCNYGLRGKASDQDQDLVEQMCTLWNIDCVSLRLDSKESGSENFQKWARDRRYQIFRDLLKELDADVIATAHHADDQLETILQKILRGSGLGAWKGMPVFEQDLFRPLLSVSKQELMKFVQEFNIPYRIDGSNEESTYARNFLRLNWFPDLDRLFPGWKKNLLNVSERALEFEAMTGFILKTISNEPGKMSRVGFLSLSEPVQSAVFYHFVESSGYNISLTGGFISQLKIIKDLQSGSSIQISDQYYLIRDRESFLISRDEDTKGTNFLLTDTALNQPIEIDGMLFEKKDDIGEYEPGVLHLDFKRIKFPLTVRTWRDGDSIQPLGMKGKQLISDHLTNRKISSATKSEALVLESFDETICAVIFPHQTPDDQIGTLSESCKCDKHTNIVLTIRKA